jgi:hypothetical protein
MLATVVAGAADAALHRRVAQRVAQRDPPSWTARTTYGSKHHGEIDVPRARRRFDALCIESSDKDDDTKAQPCR